MTRTFFVWHNEHPTFSDSDDSVLAAFPAGFTLVARVETDHEGRVFELTNHIDSDWSENAGVTKLVPRGVRSTSVGDVIVEVFEEGKAGETVQARGDKRWTIQGIGLKEF